MFKRPRQIHWTQEIASGRFAMLDMGSKQANAWRYHGRTSPPSYDLGRAGNILVRTAGLMNATLYTGTADTLADPADVSTLIAALESPSPSPSPFSSLSMGGGGPRAQEKAGKGKVGEEGREEGKEEGREEGRGREGGEGGMRVISIEGYDHLDFTLAVDARKYVYNDILRQLRYGKRKAKSIPVS